MAARPGNGISPADAAPLSRAVQREKWLHDTAQKFQAAFREEFAARRFGRRIVGGVNVSITDCMHGNVQLHISVYGNHDVMKRPKEFFIGLVSNINPLVVDELIIRPQGIKVRTDATIQLTLFNTLSHLVDVINDNLPSQEGSFAIEKLKYETRTK